MAIHLMTAIGDRVRLRLFPIAPMQRYTHVEYNKKRARGGKSPRPAGPGA